MSAVHCPEFHAPVTVSPSAREGRCLDCHPSRRHSGGKRRPRANWAPPDADRREFGNEEWRIGRTFLGIDQ